MKRLFSAVLSAALLVSLCGCVPNDEAVEDEPSASASESESVSPRPSHTSRVPKTPGADSPSSEPTDSPPPEYDPSYRLDASIPALVNGLEMPVAGATGYTSVELPVWPSIPVATPAPTQTPAPPPAPSEPPTATQPPATEPPVETQEPALAETDMVVSDGAADPDPAPESPAVTETPEETDPPSTQPPESTPEPEPTETLPPTATPTPTATPAPTATPSPTPEPTATPEPTKTPDPYADAVAVWKPGTAFVILEESGGWWRISRGSVTGWIEHRYCMINLPDVIPSMIYDDTNAYSSLFVSCGKVIPGVTGEAFYDTWAYNARLGREEFMMPILYSAARNICAAQHRALAEGNCLVVYQTFRPYDTQMAVVQAMTKLAKADPEVKAGISTPPWSMDWFIAIGVSNHQRGYALDVSMVKVYETETRYIGSRPYLYVTDCAGYVMPTAMHELSTAAISTISPSSSKLSATMNEPAIALRGYFTASRLTPLPSEWWHFNDNAAMQAASAKRSDGKYFITECLSRSPG